MQTNTLISSQELATLLEESTILDIQDLPGIRMYTLEFNKQDILVFASTEAAFVVYGPEAFDDEMAGSIHDHARAIQANA